MQSPSFDDVARRRYDRRSFLHGLASGAALATAPWLLPARGARRALAGAPASLSFESVPASTADELAVPPGYVADVLLRWGDPLHEGGPALDLAAQTAATQAAQFGFNCDFIGFVPLEPGRSDRGLLCVNHEFTSRSEMFPEVGDAPTARQVEVELAAHGVTVAEVAADDDGRWALVPGSRSNRRVTATTPCRLSGPAAGTPALRTEADAEGRTVLGTLYNCSGGLTPWGTLLSGEENFWHYFGNAPAGDDLAARSRERYSARTGRSAYGWEAHHQRFDLGREPREYHRFGWVLELDPFDPGAAPVKRTALGRMCHEGAATALADDGRVVVYTGDDSTGEFVYKFVSAAPYDPGDRAANRDLLDAGTLYAARFEPDGTGRWLPLRPEGPLADWTQADVLVHARLAASLLGATPMDRPEDVEVHPRTHRVYVVMTKNPGREEGDGGANPRAHNRHGHVVELDEDGGDLGAESFTWNLFLLGGDPARPEDAAFYAGARAGVDPVSCPDNVAFAPDGSLWIATDGQPRTFGCNDALYAVATVGPERGRTRRFLSGPRGCEVCGPAFTPDGRTLFVSVQHPGAGRGLRDPERGSTWPDGDFPRPSVVAIRRADGQPVGA